MRIVKTAEERKNEILDVAEQLFAANGFDATSTNDIIHVIGIARGTLYHHFKSKEDILDAVISRMSSDLLSKARSVAENRSLPVMERLKGSIGALNVRSELSLEVMHQVHKPQNALLHQKMREQLLGGVIPLITGLIEEGCEEGIFSCRYPKEAADMLMVYSNVAFDASEEMTPEERTLKALAFLFHAERILGAAEGSLSQVLLPLFTE